MTDTLWSDISEFQIPVNNAYPHRFIAFRSNDGGHLDANFARNIAWARGALAHGKIFGFMVYYFYRPGVNGAEILMSRVGAPSSRMTVMIDVESAGGQVAGNQSGQINAEHDHLARWLGSAHRVVGYGNTSDLNSLWPQKPAGIRLVVASYGSNPPYPGKFAHQFSDSWDTPPFGPSDINSADGMTEHDLSVMFGWVIAAPPAPPKPAPAPPHPPASAPAPSAPAEPHHRHVLAGSLEAMAHARGTTVEHLWVTTVRNLTQADLTEISRLNLSGFPVYTTSP